MIMHHIYVLNVFVIKFNLIHTIEGVPVNVLKFQNMENLKKRRFSYKNSME